MISLVSVVLPIKEVATAGRGSGRLGAETASFLSKFPVKVKPDVVSGGPTRKQHR